MHSPLSSSCTSLPPAINFHLEKQCNLRCSFCYAVFDDDQALRATRHGLPEAQASRVVELVHAAGAQKITFVGGEPTLCPYLPNLLRLARSLGLVSTLVTNGARLERVLELAPGCLDWVGLSVDSADEATQAALGRGHGDHVTKSLRLFRLLHSCGIRVKLNTVVTALNWQEDMGPFVRSVRPERWKVFQVLPVRGQNDRTIAPLLITPEQFESFVARHRALDADGIAIAAETNDDMTGSYAMIDPLGRFFSNVGGRHRYSRPILDVGVVAAFSDIQFDQARFESRGGVYDWGQTPVQLSVSAKA